MRHLRLPMKILELFSGIGAVSVATHDSGDVVCSIDINQLAMLVFRTNFDTPVWIQEISSISNQKFKDFQADLWWMSPPCQPFTRRGLKKDIDDPRSSAILRIIDAIEHVQPNHIALENVMGFENSETHQRLIEILERNGYRYASIQLCSSNLGIPNIRPRYFLTASRLTAPKLIPPTQPHSPVKVSELLDSNDALPDGLAVDEADLKKYYEAVNIVSPQSTITRCFTSAYGRSNVFSGSYLKSSQGYRRFSPREIARFLGFPDRFVLPQELTTQQLWKLIGNSVSVPCVRYVLSSLVGESG